MMDESRGKGFFSLVYLRGIVGRDGLFSPFFVSYNSLCHGRKNVAFCVLGV
jgi:hypothetical protein